MPKPRVAPRISPGFHAAQAVLFERLGKVPRSHRGLRAEFARFARGERRIEANARRFLSRAYNFKAVADYEIGPDASVTQEQARAAIAEASAFVDGMIALIT